MNREQWLQQATADLTPRLRDAGADIPEHYVSVGFPKGRPGAKGARRIGECWHGASSKDGKPHIFICPTLADAGQVLATLVHELVHASGAMSHKGDFVKRAKSVGLVKPWTSTTAGPELALELAVLASKLGPYPHAALALSTIKKQKSRLRLWECACEKPVKVRVASDDFDATCNVCEEPFEQKGGGE